VFLFIRLENEVSFPLREARCCSAFLLFPGGFWPAREFPCEYRFRESSYVQALSAVPALLFPAARSFFFREKRWILHSAIALFLSHRDRGKGGERGILEGGAPRVMED